MDTPPSTASISTVYRRIQLRDIATRAGVSISTVSRVLNNKTERISSEAIQRVMAAASELTQQNSPQPQAALDHIAIFSSSKFIGSKSDVFNTGMIRGVQDECQRLGVHVTFMITRPGDEGSDFIREKAQQSNIQGILFLGEDDRTLIENTMRHDLPIVLINSIHPGLPVDTITPANREGSMLAMQYLLDKGHRRILYATCSGRETLRTRHNTYRDMLAYAGIPYDPALVIEVPISHVDTTHAVMHEFLSQSPPHFTAAFCVNDYAALAFIRALRENGYRVPDDVSVVGFDDMSMVAFTDPPVTTVRIECEEIGARAVRELLARAVHPDRMPIRVEVACKLIERQSVRALPSATTHYEYTHSGE